MTTQNDRKKICLSIEGNIGAGKSTFLKMVSKALSVEAIFEPHEQWQAIGKTADNLLEKFYNDARRWAYTFQSYAFITRILTQEAYMKRNTHNIFITERSVYSDRHCFAKNCFEYGSMSGLEWQLYQEWFSWLTEKCDYKPDGFIYLRTDPEICYQRINKRNRFEEANVSLEYLQSIHEKHEQWLLKKKDIEHSIAKAPILILECNESFENNYEIINSHYKQIENFLKLWTHNEKIRL